MVVPVAALLRRPPENVERDVRVGLGPEGVADLGMGESGFEIVKP